MARILVTGAAGFIGSAYVRNALTGQYPALGAAGITAFDALELTGDWRSLDAVNRHSGLRLIMGDVTDRDAVAAAVPGHSMIIHFAAESHVDTSIADPARFARTNVLGTQTLLDAARAHGVARFVLVSTDEVYGPTLDVPATETRPLRPSSPYAASKAGAEMLALAAHRTHGLDVVVTRGANTYGPFQHPEKLIPRLLTRMHRGEPLPIYGDGRQRRAWLHVDDHTRAIEMVRAAGRPGAVYNIAGDTELTNEDLALRLLRTVGAGPDRIAHVADRPGHDRRYALDDTRIRRLGYAPRIGFDAGLDATVTWYREHRDWWDRYRT